MADMMQFPNNVEEFMEQYKIVDTEQVYTNGAELVPIFRMKQWFDHIEGIPSAKWHGRWIDTGSGQECSVCGEIQYGYDSGRYYCPNCGAKMDETSNATQHTECVVNLYTETKLRFILDECIENEELIEKILKALDGDEK